MAKAKEIPVISFEENLKKIENIVKTLEQRDISLEQSFSVYKEGVETIKALESRLDTIDKELIIINGGE